MKKKLVLLCAGALLTAGTLVAAALRPAPKADCCAPGAACCTPAGECCKH